ncbi:MAG: phosphoribosyltransferase family protein [Candidatus Margulisbacteria bacterium]|nr:phosphoribosyltransferase family protein [Candidatus Margulisiibacteriota bacterium]
MQQKELNISWDEFQSYANKIVSEIKKSNKTYDVIVGVARGGLFLAGYLSYHLGVKEVNIVNVQSYDDRKIVDPRVLDLPKKILGDNILLVDDILDSGTTFKIIAEWMGHTNKQYDRAVLVDKGKSSLKAEFVGINVDADCWVIYPWEK